LVIQSLVIFSFFLSWEGASDLGGVVECGFLIEEKLEGRCPRVKSEGPTRRGSSWRRFSSKLSLSASLSPAFGLEHFSASLSSAFGLELSSGELPSGFCLTGLLSALLSSAFCLGEYGR
jgi:hypothetical protein